LDVADVRGLLGLLLGDGSLVPYRTPGGGYIQLTLTAGASESCFLEEKVSEFRQFIQTKAKIVPYKTTPRSNGKTTPILRFRVSTNKLRPVYNLLYPLGERQITITTLDLLGAPAAAWLWAEGARPKKDQTNVLTRVGSTNEEALIISKWLNMLTGACSTLDSNFARPRLIFDVDQSLKIKQALNQYSPKSKQHLFQGDLLDVNSIRNTRTELQFRERSNQSERNEEPSMVGDISM